MADCAAKKGVRNSYGHDVAAYKDMGESKYQLDVNFLKTMPYIR